MINEIKNPQKSIFVSANAGSGKTFILVARILNLLLCGEDPLQILCISYTKAAANEVENRIIEKLKKWQDGDFENDPILLNSSEAEKQKAKTLYRDVVLKRQMPKIMTFHSFCMQIVSLFPVESNLNYKPNILNPLFQNGIFKKITKELFENCNFRSAAGGLKKYFSVSAIEKSIIPKLLKERENPIFKTQNTKNLLFNYLEIKEDNASLKWWEEDFWRSFPSNLLQNLFLKLENEKLTETQAKKLQKLQSFLREKKISLLEEVALTKEGEPSKIPPFSKKLLDEIFEWGEIQNYIVLKLELKKTIQTAIATSLLIDLAPKVIKLYEAEKQALDALDFDDYITITKKALEGEDRDFILFKLDGGLKHILIDEAQDTNFLQWDILSSILEEFFAGNGQRIDSRSLFIVGDEKQCIFGFQNSEPAALGLTFQKYKNNLLQLSLNSSYRTSKPLLDFIDSIFCKEPYKSLVCKGEYKNHLSNSKHNFGRIEIIEALEYSRTKALNGQEFEGFLMPWEEDEEETLKQLTAKQITEKILSILNEGSALPSDFMLLIRNRDEELFFFLKQELSRSGIDITFCDKIKLSQSLVLRDFISLLKYLLNEKDVLSLAIVLRSPMFEYKDEELKEVFVFKNNILIEHVLSLKNLLLLDIEAFFAEAFIRFGQKYSPNEAREFCQIFNIIRDYKSVVVSPSFEGFAAFFEKLAKEDASFKINLPQKETAIKISTVHGAKGLESKIVFILNATEVFGSQNEREELIFDSDKKMLLLCKKAFRCSKWEEIKKQKNDFEYEEYIRLFMLHLPGQKRGSTSLPKKTLLMQKIVVIKTGMKLQKKLCQMAKSAPAICHFTKKNTKRLLK